MGVIEAIRSGRLAERLRAPEPRTTACLNCGESLTGPFCAQCGQRNIPPYPSVRELLIDAFHELSGWDGRFAATLRGLVRHPGMLTREFLEGRRARYISPLRLYLLASLVYFVIAAAAPNIRLEDGRELFVGFRIGTTVTDSARAPASRAQQVGDAATRSLEGGSLTAEQQRVLLAKVEEAPALMRPLLRRSLRDPNGFRRDMLEAMPKMLFGLLPVFAAITALFYRGRKYPEHLYFAIHLNAFIFLALAAARAAQFTRSVPIAVVASGVVTLSILVYATLAFHRTYGESLPRTVAKVAGIGLLYCLVASAAMMVTIWTLAVLG